MLYSPYLICAEEVIQRRKKLVHALHVGQPRVQLGEDEQHASHFLLSDSTPSRASVQAEIMVQRLRSDQHAHFSAVSQPPFFTLVGS